MPLMMIEADARVLWKYEYSYMQYDLMIMDFSAIPWLEAPCLHMI